MNYFLDRIKEPSTWAGIGVLASIAGVPPSAFGMVQQAVMGLAGLYAMLAKDRV